MRTTASELTRQLELYGVNHVFGIPGVHTLGLYRGLQETHIRHVTPRHEQGAGFMADGYARVSGKPGVCFIISGPGMTNILTSMGQAYSESIPMLVISSVNSHGRMGSGDGWLHELADQRALVNGVCAFSHTVNNPGEITQVLARAFAVFDSQRPRPVHIEIPINILNAQLESTFKAPDRPPRLLAPVARKEQLIEAAHQLGCATKPVMLVGGGARHATQAVREIAEAIDAPVVMTVNARGLLQHDHALAISASASLEAVRTLIAQADVVLAIGTELGPTDYDAYEDGQFEIDSTLIRIDLDAQQLLRNQIPTIGIVGDAQASCVELLSNIAGAEKNSATDGASERLHEQGGVARASQTKSQVSDALSEREHHYLSVLSTIRDTLKQCVIVGDSTQIIYTGNTSFGMDQPASYFNSAMGFGTLGYALPAAIGAAIAAPKRSVIAISGDGGLQFSAAELLTATDEKLSITLIVHANGGYVEIDNCMRESGIEPVGVDLLTPDFHSMAKSVGWQCMEIESLQELASTLKGASTTNQSSIIVLSDRLFYE